MGCFGYICRGCGKNIREGENCVLYHIRDGVIIGVATGHYDGYGRVEEDPIFRRDDNSTINNTRSLDKSETSLPNSFMHRKKLIDGKAYDWNSLVSRLESISFYKLYFRDNAEMLKCVYSMESCTPTLDKVTNKAIEIEDDNERSKFIKEEASEIYDNADYEQLDNYSGVGAYHLKCISTANKETLVLPSEIDPDQSAGTPRKQFL